MHDVKNELPVQVSLAYMLLLISDVFLPLHIIYGMQIVGTTALLLFDYCFLARSLMLMPWNRSRKLDVSLIRKVYFSKPVDGRVSA